MLTYVQDVLDPLGQEYKTTNVLASILDHTVLPLDCVGLCRQVSILSSRYLPHTVITETRGGNHPHHRKKVERPPGEPPRGMEMWAGTFRNDDET